MVCLLSVLTVDTLASCTPTFSFGNLPTFFAFHDLDSFLQVHVTHAEDVLLDVGVHQTSDELEPRDCLCDRACPVAPALHLKVASGGDPLESSQVVSHPFINLLKQPQEHLNVDRFWYLTAMAFMCSTNCASVRVKCTPQPQWCRTD